MIHQRKVFFITGSIGKGKTTFLNNIALLLRRQWRADGFICLPERRSTHTHSADHYSIKLLRESCLYPWAQKKKDGDGYIFEQETQHKIIEYFDRQKLQDLEIVFFDDLGFLEVEGDGFASLLTLALGCGEGAIIVGAKKQAIPSLVQSFNIESYSIFDLDEANGKACKKRLVREIAKMDGESIGVFSSINGMIEVSLGSILHASRFPLKGYILVGVQNFFLILFSKELKGRGLVAISLISAAMKSFSPAGGRLKPMLYIFLQGLFFALPISLFGHHFFACLLGSIAIELISLVFKFASAYLTFGMALFDSSLNMFNALLTSLSLPTVSLEILVFLLVILKLIVALIISLVAYFFDFSFLLLRWRKKIDTITPSDNIKIVTYSWKEAIRLAFSDMILKRYLLPLFLTLSLIYFFSNLSAEGFAGVVVRALVISWFALVLSRRIDFNKIVHLLNKHGFEHLAVALNKAISLVQSFRERL